jgi:hypothetical protein
LMCAMLVVPAATKQYPAQGPAPQGNSAKFAPAPAPAGGQEALFTPETLTTLSQKMGGGMQQQTGLSKEMFSQQKIQLAEHKAQRSMGIRAGIAEDAHVSAADSLDEASEQSTAAAEARATANSAVEKMRAAKAALLSMQDKEQKQEAGKNSEHKELNRKQVEFETASMKAERARQIAAAADTTASSARDDKTTADEAQTMAEKSKAAALEKKTRMEADQDEKNTQLKLCEMQQAKTAAALAKAEKELDDISEILGQKEAEAAKIEVQQEIATKNRELMRKQYDAKQTLAHSLDETAFQAESRATAAATQSRAMASLAKSEADDVDGAMPAAPVMNTAPAPGPAAYR